VPTTVCFSQKQVADILLTLEQCNVDVTSERAFIAWLSERQRTSEEFQVETRALIVTNLTEVSHAVRSNNAASALRFGPIVHVTVHPLTAIAVLLRDPSFHPAALLDTRLSAAATLYVSFHSSLLEDRLDLVEDDAPQLLAYEEATLAAFVTFLNLPFRRSTCPGATRPAALPNATASVTWADIRSADSSLEDTLWRITQRLGYSRDLPISVEQQVVELTAADDAGLVRKVWEVAIAILSVGLPVSCCLLLTALCCIRRYEQEGGHTRRRTFR